MVMMFFFFAVLLAVVVLPVTIFTVMRVVPRVVDRTVPPIVDRFSAGVPLTQELDARLTRIEEAIDAMATEIDRMRTRDLESQPVQRQLPGEL